MVFGSLVTRRNPIPCCPSADSVTAHNIQHAQDRQHDTTWNMLDGYTSIEEVYVMVNWNGSLQDIVAKDTT
jgi:hypothetical protein